MEEPYLSIFREMIRLGAACQDIHDVATVAGFAAGDGHVDDECLEREVGRVDAHRRTLLPVLERYVRRADAILDVGCSTGGTTIALALSETLQAAHVVGVDPNPNALEAARVRMQGHRLDGPRLRFEEVAARDPLPFADASFDLVTFVSVLEFISTPADRARIAAEIRRVTKPGGWIYLATPSPWRLREHHTRRWFGHVRRKAGFPWSSTPGEIRRMFEPCVPIPLDAFVVADVLRRHRMPGARLSALLSPFAACLAWQKHLFLVPGRGTSDPDDVIPRT